VRSTLSGCETATCSQTMAVQHEEDRVGMRGNTSLDIGNVDYCRGSNDGIAGEDTVQCFDLSEKVLLVFGLCELFLSCDRGPEGKVI